MRNSLIVQTWARIAGELERKTTLGCECRKWNQQTWALTESEGHKVRKASAPGLGMGSIAVTLYHKERPRLTTLAEVGEGDQCVVSILLDLWRRKQFKKG